MLACADITQDSGEVALAAQQHLADRDFQRKLAAILALSNDFASEAGGARRVACAVIIKGTVALVFIELGYQDIEVFSDDVCGSIAKHLLGGRVDGRYHATIGMQGDNAIHHRIENCLDQRGAIAHGLLRGIFHSDIAKHQHRAHHLTIAVANWCTTVGDGALAAITGDQYGVIGQPPCRAMRQCFLDRDRGRLSSSLIDDVKNFLHQAIVCFRRCPTRQPFGKGVQQRHMPVGIGGDDRIADRVERHRELFFADVQGGVGQL